CPPTPRPTLFPYTTLFRSVRDRQAFILLNPATVRPGSSVGVTGSGFDPGAQIDLTIKKTKDDRGTSLGFVQADKGGSFGGFSFRSEEHTSELQSRENLVCR